MRVSSILDEMVKKYDGKVRVVYKNFVVHPDTATDAHLAACAASKQGKIKDFTGISAPYEPPENPDLVIDSSQMDVQECVEQILVHRF